MTASGVAADGSPIPRDGIPNLAYSNTSNRITTAGWEYDSAGNQTRALAEDGVTWLKFEYDAANRIRVVKRDDAGQTMLQAFMYGSTNARVIDYDGIAGVNKLLASTGGTTLVEYTEFQHTVPTWTKSYTYLGDTQLATVTPNGAGGETTEFNHPDRLGTRTVTNQQTGGNAEQAHLPFGTALNGESSVTNNDKRFTSYDRSPLTGLDYAVNRTYDSKQGRFTQVDPIGMQSASLVAPQTLNLYSYCGNDPINYSDPSGLFFGSLFRWIWKAVRIIAAVVFAVLAVLAFSIQQHWAGVALAMASASIVASLFNLKTLQRIIAIAAIAISVIRIRMALPAPTPPAASFIGLGEGHGIDINVLSIFANVGAVASSLAQPRKRGPRRRSKPWCPPVTIGATFYGNNSQLDVYEKAVNDMFRDGGREQGGWIYQNRKGQLKAIRKVREPRDGGMYIFLDKPPPMKGWRVVGTFHTHVDDLGPSGDDVENVNGVPMASGDYLPNYRYKVPGLVLTRTRDGGIGNYTYGPPPGFFNVGLPAGCQSRRHL